MMNISDKPINSGQPKTQGGKMQGPYEYGITLREYYAGLAMQGLLSADTDNLLTINTIAEWSVQCSDALIAELEKEQQ